MKQCRNVVAVVEGNVELDTHPAIVQAVELVRQNDGQLTLMDVVDAPDSVVKDYEGMFNPSELFEMFVRNRSSELEVVAEGLRQSGVNVAIKVASGRAFIEIIRQVIAGRHDLLIKVANDNDGSFGGNDLHLMRKCPKPVWMLRSQPSEQAGRVLAAIDLSLEEDEQGRAMNNQIMELAIATAALKNSELHVLSCWSLYGESALRSSGFLKVSEQRLEQVLLEEEKRQQITLDRMLSRHSDVKCQPHLIKGEASKRIPAFVSEVNIDCVVMGTVGRTGIPGLFIGNTAETILQCIDASVITVKPGGFESPVK